MPNKLLGQNFLKNPAVIQKIIKAIDPAEGETVVEVGPGRGALTVPLAEVCEKAGATLIAVEKDARLAETLNVPGAEIFVGDVLDELPALAAKKKYKLVGNLPYYLTGQLLRMISEAENPPVRCVFMVQKEVAERLVANPPDMNRLAASVQYWALPHLLTSVPRKDFFPIPRVDSAVVVLEEREKPQSIAPEQYFQTVRYLFAQPRKTILNNLAAAGMGEGIKSSIIKELENLFVKPEGRPQDLSIPQIIQIAEKFSK